MASPLALSHTLLRSTDPLLKTSMIICHGLFGSKQNWKTMSHALHKKGCGSICTADLRNHGESPHAQEMGYIEMAADIVQLSNALSLNNVCLVGHSMGGKAVMCAALVKPEKFKQLVVLDSSPVFSSGAHGIMPYVKLMNETDLYRAERETDGSLTDVRRYLMNEWKQAVPDETMRQFLLTNLESNKRELVWRVNLKAIERCWHQIVGFPDSEVYGRTYDGPVLFVAGGKSEYIKHSHIPTIRSYFPQARIVRIANAGHWVHVDAPHTVLSLLTAFVKGPAEQILLDGVEELE